MNSAFQAMAVTWPPQKSILPFIWGTGESVGDFRPPSTDPTLEGISRATVNNQRVLVTEQCANLLRGVKSRPSSSGSLTPIHDFSFLLVDLVRWLIKMHVRNSRLTPHFKPAPPSLCVNSCRLCQSKYIWGRSPAVVIGSYSSDHTREGQLHQTKDNCFPPNLWTSLLT